MTSEVSMKAAPASRTVLEWTVVSAGVVTGAAVVVGGLGYGMTNTTGVGAGFFPVVAGGAIALGSGIWGAQLVASLRRPAAPSSDPEVAFAFDPTRVDQPTDTAIGVIVADGIEEEEDAVMPTRAGVRRIALVAGSLVLAALLLPFLGYVVTMSAMLFAVMTLVSERKWWVALLVAVGSALASRFVFETLLGTALPHPAWGVLRSMGL